MEGISPVIFDHPIVPLLAVICMTGCGTSNSEYVAVTGTVTYQGEPVEGATVAFRGEGSAPPALGVTSASGQFSLRTGANPGAIPGEHIVTVTKYVVEAEPLAEEVSMEDAGRKKPATTIRTAIPSKYASPSGTDIRYVVKPGGGNQFTIDLGTNPFMSTTITTNSPADTGVRRP
jgi:hypothetical protein